MKSFVIGANKTAQVTVTVNSYERATTGEYYDDNWLSCEVNIRVGGFNGKYSASFLTSEFLGLHKDLEQLNQSLAGSFSFEPLERQLELKLSCDKLGQINVSGVAIDEARIGTSLHFSISFDQTYLARTIAELRDVLDAFPVRV